VHQVFGHDILMVFKQTALRLLDCDFPDKEVRAFATRVLKRVPDEQLEDFLLQLTQVNIECHCLFCIHRPVKTSVC